MTKKEKDIALFVAFCIEEYAADRGMQSQDVNKMIDVVQNPKATLAVKWFVTFA